MVVVLEHVCKAFGEKAVISDCSLRLEDGRAYALLGPSGCGKTTLLRLVAGLERPDSGKVSGAEGRRLSAIFQEDRLFENLSAEKNVLLTAAPGFSRSQARSLLAELGLGADAGLPVRGFSGGMRRRVALARALAAEFDLLLLDEPFSGLDAESRDRALNALRPRLNGKCALLVTHARGDAEALGAEVLGAFDAR